MCPALTLKLQGTSYEIGVQHGCQLASQILDQLTIYRDLFQEACKFEWAHVRIVAEEFKPAIAKLAPELLNEMQGIADGVKSVHTAHGWGAVDLLDIIALNARSEIALGQWDDGCTAVGLHLPASRTQILAQNWDWRETVGKNLALLSIARPGVPQIWIVAEPGIVGKIGFNVASVGVCLNAIRARPISTALLPIHLLLRAALEQASVDAAIAAIERLGGAASSQHVLIADARGASGLELSPRGGAYLRADAAGVLVHTNHFLENALVDERPWLSGSPVRLARAREICGELLAERGGAGIDAALLRARLFADTTNAPQAICCSPDPERQAKIKTLFNIVMVFRDGEAPSGEVVFGRPGTDEESEVVHLPF